MSVPTPPSPEKRALIDAFETVMQAESEHASPMVGSGRRLPRRTRPFAWVVLVASTSLFAIGASTRAPWLGFPQPLDEQPIVQEASLRLAIALEAQRIVRYQREHGALPSRLEDAGPVVPGVRYHRGTGGDFELRGSNGDASAMYRSSEGLRRFVGSSYDIVTRRAQ